MTLRHQTESIIDGKSGANMTETPPTYTHGGSRPGSGRPPKPEIRKVPMAFKFDQEIAAYLATVSNKTTTIEDALRLTEAFKTWCRLNASSPPCRTSHEQRPT